MERTELALVQRRGTTADKLALLPHEPIRAGWTKSTRRNKTRLLIRRQQAGAAQEPDEEDIVHTRVCPLGVSAISRFLALALTTANLSDTERRPSGDGAPLKCIYGRPAPYYKIRGSR